MVLEEFYIYNSLLFNVVKFIGEIDCGMSTANNFIKYNYCKPTLDTSDVKVILIVKGFVIQLLNVYYLHYM